MILLASFFPKLRATSLVMERKRRRDPSYMIRWDSFCPRLKGERGSIEGGYDVTFVLWKYGSPKRT